jgi:hypothetical protein
MSGDLKVKLPPAKKLGLGYESITYVQRQFNGDIQMY